MREKMIEILRGVIHLHDEQKEKWILGGKVGNKPTIIESFVDVLIANGVTIPVRCKDCKYWKPGDSFSGDSLDDMQRIGGCPIMRFGRRENDFCCEGERRTDD